MTMTAPTRLDTALAQPRSLGEARRLLVRTRGTLRELAGRCSADLSLRSKVVRGLTRPRSLERRRARALGMRRDELFPEWYGQTERPAKRIGPRALLSPKGATEKTPLRKARRQRRGERSPRRRHDHNTWGRHLKTINRSSRVLPLVVSRSAPSIGHHTMVKKPEKNQRKPKTSSSGVCEGLRDERAPGPYGRSHGSCEQADRSEPLTPRSLGPVPARVFL